MKKLLSFMIMLALCSTLALAFPMPVCAAPAGTVVQNETELSNALASPETLIEIGADITIQGTITIPAGKKVVGSSYLVILSIDSTGELIVEENGEADFSDLTVKNYGTIEIYPNGSFFTGNLRVDNLGTITNNGHMTAFDGINSVAPGKIEGDAPYFDTDYVYAQYGSPLNYQLVVTNSPATFTPSNIGSDFLLSTDGWITGVPSSLADTTLATITANKGIDASFTRVVSIIVYDKLGILVIDPFPTVTDPNATNITTRIDADYGRLSWVDLFDENGGHLQQLTEGTDFTSANGSTIITLLPSFLQTLHIGTYQIGVTFGFGIVYVPLVVTARVPSAVTTTTPANPKTGDSSNLPLWLGLGAGALVGLGLCGGVLYRRRHCGRKAS